MPFGDLSGDDLEVVDLTDMGFNGGFKDEKCGGTFGVNFHFIAFFILHAGTWSGVGKTLEMNSSRRPTPIFFLAEVQKTGIHAPVQDAGGDPFPHFIFFKRFFFKEDLHQRFIILRSFFNQFGPQFFRLSASEAGISVISGFPPSAGYL